MARPWWLWTSTGTWAASSARLVGNSSMQSTSASKCGRQRQSRKALPDAAGGAGRLVLVGRLVLLLGKEPRLGLALVPAAFLFLTSSPAEVGCSSSSDLWLEAEEWGCQLCLHRTPAYVPGCYHLLGAWTFLALDDLQSTEQLIDASCKDP